MAEGTVECANCGRENPAWAQVCRTCGAAIQLAATDGVPASSLPGALAVDQGSLLAIGGALGTIAAAIIIGVIIGGILPPAPPVAVATPTPNPSASVAPATPQPSIDPSASVNPSASAAPVLPGTLTFGLGLNSETQRVTNPTDTFTPGTTFAHSVELTAPFGVTQIGEGVWQIAEDGTETQVINPEENQLTVDPEASVDGFTVPTNALLDPLGAGTFVMRVYRGSELLAQGTFILTE
jgi:hypothetical protein